MEGPTFGNRHLVEFRAGRMTVAGKMLHPDTRKGLLYLYQSDDSSIHFCWKNRTTNKVEVDLNIFPGNCEFKRVEKCKTGRVYLLKFKWRSKRLFFWMQEPKVDKDDELCYKINEAMNNAYYAKSLSIKQHLTHGIFDSCWKNEKCGTDSGKIPMEFNELCDDVIDIILCNLEPTDLANVSDTSKRLRNITGSVFARKYRNHGILFDAFQYSIWTTRSRQFETIFKKYEKKPFIDICDVKIGFKLLRNFGEHIRFIRISSFYRNELKFKIPIAFENLNKYILEYCTDSLEILHMDPMRTEWNIAALEQMPNLRSTYLRCFPKTIENHFPKLERALLCLSSDAEVHSFISFLKLNPQITYLKLYLMLKNLNDLIYSSIEQNLKQLKIFKIYNFGDHERNAIEPMPIYRFKTVESFSINERRIHSDCCFEFNNIKKIRLQNWERTDLNLKWMNAILNIRKLKIFKISRFDGKTIRNNGRTFIEQVSQLPELEQIIVGFIDPKYYLILQEILGSKWKQIEMKETEFRVLKVKYQRIL